MRTTPEEIIRIAVVPDAAKPLPIFDVIRGSQRHAPIASDCEWALVTHIPADSQGQEGYIVYYIDARGWPGDHDEFDTVEDALAHVERQTGITPSSWHVVSYTRAEPSPHAQFDASVLSTSRLETRKSASRKGIGAIAASRVASLRVGFGLPTL